MADQCAPTPADHLTRFAVGDVALGPNTDHVAEQLADVFGSLTEANAIARGLLFACIAAAADGVTPAATLSTGDGKTRLVVSARLERDEPDEPDEVTS